MRILLLNQTFHPDVMATAQQLTDLAVGLRQAGHEVTVITGDRGYDDPSRRFARRESWQGINIIRIGALSLGKQSRWRRAANFASFLINCTWKLILLRRHDVTVALTSPPLISFLGAVFARLKGGKFFFWVMDLNPDEAIAAGWLKPDSGTAKLLERFLRYSFRHSERIIALDRFMKERIVAKGVAPDRVAVLPPWAREDSVAFDPVGREAFRSLNDLAGKFVVMYAGNHSPCHPLDTLLAAAKQLAAHSEIRFFFVGGGSEQKKVTDFKSKHNLQNIQCLPYQPFDGLSAVLSSADLHTVVMGEGFVGIVHPCKLYNVLTIGSPFLYIGPSESHISELISSVNGNLRAYSASHGDVETVTLHILDEARRAANQEKRTVSSLARAFSRRTLLPQLIALLESQTGVENLTTSTPANANYLSAAR